MEEMSMAVDRPNALCGTIFVALGAFFAWQSLNLEIGSAFRMGPGFFPLGLASILILLGLVIIGYAFRVGGEPVGAIAWRGIVLILPAPIFFGLTVRGLGFVPAIFFTALIASFASAKMRLVPAVLLSAALTVFTAFVFVQALGLPFRLFGPWL
ncbi:tripartite tricarboxylate transporter TctB family protein [Mesorhizobium camelthorni]|uniref:Tripartite tricarboxylate transporter TctB family protein n=2 Tax=Allomesorhizobium camelthorni TaxID=475069 RepID=A0A6G4W6P8_9HYPH|nr:tripartite tricarboxylate transporter TctB family protein [Mesorhizobium camelthorni]